MKIVSFFLPFLFCILILTDHSYALCVNASEANLRSGAGAGHRKTWEVFTYMPFKKLAVKGNWYKVRDVDGDIHWIYSKLVTNKYRCAVVRTDKASVRSGPGPGYSRNSLSPAMRYASFKVIEMTSSWVKVKDEFGDHGWIARKLLWIQ
ncbi:MAG: SH3 domain-containing protein [Nitrospirota bacterium]|nr:SH3 domain-containing protein [Nitrospirota bacterium]